MRYLNKEMLFWLRKDEKESVAAIVLLLNITGEADL
jgi:hypothetical protein